MSTERVLASIGLWRKGSSTVTVTLDGEWVLIAPLGSAEFKVSMENWLLRVARLLDEGWVRDGGYSPEEEVSKVRNSTVAPTKIMLPGDTVLRRKDGKVYLMTRQEGGWSSFAFPVVSEAWVAEKFNVRLGKWSADEHGEFCPVTRVPHRMISKPPRPGDRKTG